MRTMEFKGKGVNVQVDPAGLEDEQLVGLAQEIADVARERGIELPFAAGVAAVEGVVTTNESLAEQLPAATQGYQAVMDTLNGSRDKRDLLPVATGETIAAEFEAWLTEDKLAYVVAAQEADPDVRFTLVATPNVTVTPKELAKAARDFGENQPHEAYVDDALYEKYTPEQLSGTSPDNGNAVIFSLIPNADGMNGIVADDLRAQLSALQATHAYLKVPSPLEAVTYWQTLRTAGGQLADEATFETTNITHFDLPEQRSAIWLSVPSSGVTDGGKASLSASTARNDSYAYVRIAVG